MSAPQAVTAALVAWMVVAAVRNRPRGLLNWPMFTHTCSVLVELKRVSAGGAAPLNPYRHLPSHAPQLTARDFDRLLGYLQARHGADSIEGGGVFRGGNRELLIEVVDGRVVVRGIRRQFHAADR